MGSNKDVDVRSLLNEFNLSFLSSYFNNDSVFVAVRDAIIDSPDLSSFIKYYPRPKTVEDLRDYLDTAPYGSKTFQGIVLFCLCICSRFAYCKHAITSVSTWASALLGDDGFKTVKEHYDGLVDKGMSKCLNFSADFDFYSSFRDFVKSASLEDFKDALTTFFKLFHKSVIIPVFMSWFCDYCSNDSFFLVLNNLVESSVHAVYTDIVLKYICGIDVSEHSQSLIHSFIDFLRTFSFKPSLEAMAIRYTLFPKTIESKYESVYINSLTLKGAEEKAIKVFNKKINNFVDAIQLGNVMAVGNFSTTYNGHDYDYSLESILNSGVKSANSLVDFDSVINFISEAIDKVKETEKQEANSIITKILSLDTPNNILHFLVFAYNIDYMYLDPQGHLEAVDDYDWGRFFRALDNPITWGEGF